MPSPRRACHGFTLIELSVVLVLLGLLAGGITGGMALMKNQRLRKVSLDATTYMVAAQQFKQKYGYVPGDFPGAGAVWGAATGGTGDCTAAGVSTPGTGTQTCNGDGNSIISRMALSTGQVGEPWRAWQHLSNAGLVAGRFTGVPTFGGTATCTTSFAGSYGGSSYYTVWPGADETPPPTSAPTNFPAGTIPASMFSWFGIVNPGQPMDVSSGSVSWTFYGAFKTPQLFPGDYSNSLLFSGLGGFLPVIYGDDAFQIDSKFDDGKPGTGTILANAYAAMSPFTCSGTSTQTQWATATYNLTSTDTPTCNLTFMRTFASTPDKPL